MKRNSLKHERRNRLSMKVVVPIKLKKKVRAALTELYLLKQAIELLEDSKAKEGLLKKIKKIRNLLKDEG